MACAPAKTCRCSHAAKETRNSYMIVESYRVASGCGQGAATWYTQRSFIIELIIQAKDPGLGPLGYHNSDY